MKKLLLPILLSIVFLSGCGGSSGGGSSGGSGSTNTQPTLASISNQSTNEDTAKLVTLSGSDSDAGDTLTYSATSSTSNVTPSISGTTLTLTPAANWNGTSTITAKVNDGTVDSATKTFTLTVSAVNDAPVVGDVSNQTTNEDTTKTVTLSETDADTGDSHTFLATSSTSNIVPSVSGSTLTLTPAANWSGTATITFKVNDGSVDSTAKTFTLTVSAVNDAPLVSTSIPDTINSVGASFSLNISSYITDIESDTLTFSATLTSGGSLPSWLSVNSSTGVLSGTPSNSDIDNISIKAIATDSLSRNASDNFSLTVGCGALISGTSGDNSLSATSSYDIINGYGGTDTVVFTGNYSNYTVSQTRAKLLKVVDNRSNGGANQNTNILHSIEELEFADLTKVVSHSDSSEFNISTSGYGKYWSEITELSNCGLIASWTTDGQDGDLYGVYNQRLASDGELSGSEFRANTTTSNSQYEPSSAELNNGKTIVVWADSVNGSNATNIKGQIYNKDGSTSGSELVVNTYTSSWQTSPDIAPMSDGGFIVVWFSNKSGATGIHAQRYNETGATVGSEFEISSVGASLTAGNPSIARFSNGNFIVVWHQNTATPCDVNDIYGSLFDSSANRIGSVTKISTTNLGYEQYPSVAVLTNQKFVVSWNSGTSNTSTTGGIYAQGYDASSFTKSGSEFLVSRAEPSSPTAQSYPHIASFGSDGFSICWLEGGVDCRIYTSLGNPTSAEFNINSYSASAARSKPSLTKLNDGGFIVTSVNGNSVIGQRFDSTGTILKVISLATK